MNEVEDDRDYEVVINDEEQYSIWPAARAMPTGWRSVGFTGKRRDCLTHIQSVWLDLRPLSLRHRMDEVEPGATG